MAALTVEQAQADIARLGARVGDQEAHAKGARRRRMLRGIGAAIRDADDLIARIGAADLLSEADRLHLIGECRAVRTALHDQIRTLSYEAWFWTEAWQAGEREAEAQ